MGPIGKYKAARKVKKEADAATKRTKVGIDLAGAYNRANRGGKVSPGDKAKAAQFIAENPGATSKGAPRLTGKYR